MSSTLPETALNAEVEPLCVKQDLYLKPLAKIEITVKLPRINVPGQSISNWDLMERLKKAVQPATLDAIRVSVSTMDNVIFEAELPNKTIMKKVIKSLDTVTMKVSGFAEALRVRAAEAKSDAPSRHDWDLFYMKNQLDESKPGERPDTVYLSKLPVKWFTDGILDTPSVSLLRRAMDSFGAIRDVDIPVCDPLRTMMPAKISGIQTKGFGFGQDVFFEAYIQYESYSGFATAMKALKDMKWLKRIDGRIFQANVKVDFDRTKHLSEKSIERRRAEREKLLNAKKKKQEDEDRVKIEEQMKIKQEEEEKERRREERERKRKMKRDLERQKEEERKQLEKAREEMERKAKQKRILEAQRLLEEVFARIQRKEDKRRAAEEAQLKEDLKVVKLDLLSTDDKEDKLRNALLRQREMRMREKLKEKLAAHAKRQASSSSDDSSSEDEKSRKKRKKKEKKQKAEKHRREERRDRHRTRTRSRSRKRSRTPKRRR